MSEWPDSEMAYIAVCDEHGLHGERDTCFVCGRECQQVQMVTASWRGLLAHLDGMYPEAIFHGATGDPGDKIVVLARKLAQAHEQIEQARADAVKEIAAWLRHIDRLYEIPGACLGFPTRNPLWDAGCEIERVFGSSNEVAKPELGS